MNLELAPCPCRMRLVKALVSTHSRVGTLCSREQAMAPAKKSPIPQTRRRHRRRRRYDSYLFSFLMAEHQWVP